VKICVTVPGEPVPQGSLRSGGRGQLFYSNASRLKPYRTNVAAAVREEAGDGHEQWTGPVTVRVAFTFERPTSHVKKNGELRAGVAFDKVTAPDLDKLARSVLDAITQSGVYADDAQVVILAAEKAYGPEAETWLEIEHHGKENESG
jgi:Holliday junction resolvase RusA-like endonuclease